MLRSVAQLAFLLLVFLASASSLSSSSPSVTVSNYTRVADGPWSSREGLMGVEFKGALFISGGRQSHGVGFSDEVWRSDDGGGTWVKTSSGVIPSRAYHTHVVVDDCQIIMGGQTFFTFYNDVWRSCDDKGEVWERITENAEWPVRSGHAALVTSSGSVIIAGGCYNKNGNPAARSFRGDVWKSEDGGKTYTLQASEDDSGWKARSGPRLVETSEGRLLIVAGEVGFTDDTQLVDIWGSDDEGVTWELVSEQPGFSPRSGHGVVKAANGDLLVIAGWPHLHDLWASGDGGESFEKVGNDVWNCECGGDDNCKECGKFDFWPIVTEEGKLVTVGGSGAYSTFGKLWQDTWVAEIEL